MSVKDVIQLGNQDQIKINLKMSSRFQPEIKEKNGRV